MHVKGGDRVEECRVHLTNVLHLGLIYRSKEKVEKRSEGCIWSKEEGAVEECRVYLLITKLLQLGRICVSKGKVE